MGVRDAMCREVRPDAIRGGVAGWVIESVRRPEIAIFETEDRRWVTERD